MRIYLGGPSAEIDRVLAFRDRLVAEGHTITEPWWERIEEAKRRGWQHDGEVPYSFMVESTDRNLRGIETAERVVVLAKAAGGFSSGAAGEIGYGLARSPGLPPILVGDVKGYVLKPRCTWAPDIEVALEMLRSRA